MTEFAIPDSNSTVHLAYTHTLKCEKICHFKFSEVKKKMHFAVIFVPVNDDIHLFLMSSARLPIKFLQILFTEFAKSVQNRYISVINYG